MPYYQAEIIPIVPETGNAEKSDETRDTRPVTNAGSAKHMVHSPCHRIYVLLLCIGLCGTRLDLGSFLEILAPELNDRMLSDILDLENGIIFNLHIRSIDPVS